MKNLKGSYGEKEENLPFYDFMLDLNRNKREGKRSDVK
jgi:hypothetical protein